MNQMPKPKTSDLIERSRKILAEKKLDEVWKAGIHRDPTKYHITVMYPPLKTMAPIPEETIFSDFQNKRNEFTLYIHIPFCSGKCSFCYFYQIEKPETHLVNTYLAALKKEIRIVEKKIRDQIGPVKVKSIFFGGGSPTMLSADQFSDLMGSVKESFELPAATEITVEIHPEICKSNGRSLLECYRGNGVNRLNIGVQSFDNHILKLTNRRHTASDALQTYKSARSAGFENINIDLLYPLPDLTPPIWEQTLNTAFGLEPESVTTYFTAFRQPSPIFKFFHKSPQRFPNEATNHLFRIMTMEKAKERGFRSDELIDWFVKPREGFHYEHQKSEARQTEDVQLLSFGSGVFTYLNYHQYYNYPDVKTYCECLNQEKLPIWKGIRLSRTERLSRAMVLGVKSGVVNMERLANNFQENVYQKYHDLLHNLQRLGLLEKSNQDIRLSDKGILFADEIAVQFLSSEIRQKLMEQKHVFDPELEMINTYNFMYDMDGLNLV